MMTSNRIGLSFSKTRLGVVNPLPSAYNKRRKHAFQPPCSLLWLLPALMLVFANQIMTVTVDAINAIKQQADAFGNMRVSEGFDILLRTWNRLFDSADSPRCCARGCEMMTQRRFRSSGPVRAGASSAEVDRARV